MLEVVNPWSPGGISADLGAVLALMIRELQRSFGTVGKVQMKDPTDEGDVILPQESTETVSIVQVSMNGKKERELAERWELGR